MRPGVARRRTDSARKHRHRRQTENLENGEQNTTLQFDGPVAVDGTLGSGERAVSTLRFAPGIPGKVTVSSTGAFEVSGLPGMRTRLEQDGVPGGTAVDHRS